MVSRTYGSGDRLHVQAQQIWLILSAWARVRKRTITYSRLAKWLGGRHRPDFLGRQLGIIGYYCLDNGLPPLNIIVVSKATGAPGSEAVVSKGKTVPEDQEAVFATDWFAIRPPSLKDLRDTWEEMTDS